MADHPLPSSSSVNPTSHSTDPSLASETSLEIRHSSRVSRPPIWSRDYTCPTIRDSNSSTYSIANYISYSHLSPSFQVFLSSISHIKEPRSYHEAMGDSCWQAEMDTEIDALEANRTWEIVPLPLGKSVIGNKWVYKVKYHPDGSVDRFKARLVAKGYTQLPRIDYHNTFSHVVKIGTVRCLLSIVVVSQWPLYQKDVTNAFLQGDLEEEIYMAIPQGFGNHGEFGETKVCRLLKSLYGLKQASRQWNLKFASIMTKAGFRQSKPDHSLFFKKDGEFITLLLVYVDDIVISGNHEASIVALKEHLHAAIHIKDLGNLRYFLGIEVARSKKGICLNQRKYALELVSDMGLSGARVYDTPMEH